MANIFSFLDKQYRNKTLRRYKQLIPKTRSKTQITPLLLSKFKHTSCFRYDCIYVHINPIVQIIANRIHKLRVGAKKELTRSQFHDRIVEETTQAVEDLLFNYGVTKHFFFSFDGVPPKSSRMRQREKNAKGCDGKDEEEAEQSSDSSLSDSGSEKEPSEDDDTVASPKNINLEMLPGTILSNRILQSLMNLSAHFSKEHETAIYISPPSRFGEGEMKIMEHLRKFMAGVVSPQSVLLISHSNDTSLFPVMLSVLNSDLNCSFYFLLADGTSFKKGEIVDVTAIKLLLYTLYSENPPFSPVQSKEESTRVMSQLCLDFAIVTLLAGAPCEQLRPFSKGVELKWKRYFSLLKKEKEKFIFNLERTSSGYTLKINANNMKFVFGTHVHFTNKYATANKENAILFFKQLTGCLLHFKGIISSNEHFTDKLLMKDFLALSANVNSISIASSLKELQDNDLLSPLEGLISMIGAQTFILPHKKLVDLAFGAVNVDKIRKVINLWKKKNSSITDDDIFNKSKGTIQIIAEQIFEETKMPFEEFTPLKTFTLGSNTIAERKTKIPEGSAIVVDQLELLLKYEKTEKVYLKNHQSEKEKKPEDQSNGGGILQFITTKNVVDNKYGRRGQQSKANEVRKRCRKNNSAKYTQEEPGNDKNPREKRKATNDANPSSSKYKKQ